MRASIKWFVTSAAIALASPALAVPTITSASVTGPTGTIWNTQLDSLYNLFISDSSGAYVNPTDNFSGLILSGLTDGDYNYSLVGDGFPTNTPKAAPGTVQIAPNSDPFYTLTLRLTEGGTTKTLSGLYTPLTGAFINTGSRAVFVSGGYDLSGFSWYRTVSNLVGKYTTVRTIPAGSPGSGFDYQGAFTITAVPEPATWGLMIVGFGAVGVTLRTRKKSTLAAA